MNNKYLQRCVLLSLLSLVGASACIKRTNQNSKNTAPKEPIGGDTRYELVDPDGLAVAISAAEVSLQEFSGKYKLPTFDMRFNGNDYVKILRCQGTYRDYLEYSLATLEKGKTNTRDDRKWVWVDSFGDTKNCKIASEHFNAASFQDMGAKNGTYFYLVNPCVSAEISASGKDECSHNLTLTNTISFRDSPGEVFGAKSAELTDAESEYDAIMSRLLGLSRAIMNQRQACEFNINQIETQRNVETAGWDLLSASIAIVGFLGVRALLSRSAMHGISDQLSTNYKSVKSSLATLGSAPSPDKNLFTAGLFAGGYAISMWVRKAQSERGSGGTHPSCNKADELAKQILEIQNQKLLDKTREKIVRVSGELKAIDSAFQGYSEASFTSAPTTDIPSEPAPGEPAPAKPTEPTSTEPKATELPPTP